MPPLGKEPRDGGQGKGKKRGWEGQSGGRRLSRIGQVGKRVEGGLGRLINQSLPTVALFPKIQTNKINKKPARPGSVSVHSKGGRRSQTLKIPF